jgi:membrane protein
LNRQEAQQLWKKVRTDLIFTQATALAFTTVSSIVPILAVAFFLFNAFGGIENLMDKIEPLINENLAPAFSQQISEYLDKFLSNTHAGTVGFLGVLGFVVTSISTLATIENTFNYIWGASKPRSWARRVPTYWSLLTIGPLLLGASFALSSKAMLWLKNDNGALSHFLVWSFAILPYLSSCMLFTALYIFIPNVTVNRRDALKAGAITGVVFELAKLIYAVYATNAIGKNAIYGSLVIIPLFLLWLYVVWLIVLIGAELCLYFQYKRVGIPYKFDSEERLNPFIITDIIEVLGAVELGTKAGLTLHGLLLKLRVPTKELSDHLDFLLEQEIIVCSGGDFINSRKKYYLVVPKEQVNLSLIIQHLEPHRYLPQSARGLSINEKIKSIWTQSP